MAFAGICTAISAVVLYMASIVPTGRLVLCAVASVTVCVLMIKFGIKGALLLYAAVSAIAFVLLPDKTIFFGYLLFFGNYPIVKALIEKKNSLVFEWVLKILLFCLYAIVAYLGINLFFPSLAQIEYSLWLVLVATVAVAAVYDVALSLLISELIRRFAKILF